MIITLTGTNDFRRQQELSKLITSFIAEHGDLAVERLDGAESSLERVCESVQSQPFLTDRKLVIIDEPSSQKSLLERFDLVLTLITATTDLIIVEPKLDKRLTYYKLLKQQTDFREFGELDINKLNHWLTQYANEQGGRLSANEARFLIERVGANQQLLASEVDKLLLFDSHISQAAIELLTEILPQSSIFELLDAAFSGNRQRVLELYQEQRQLKVEPQQIIALLGWQLHTLAVIKAAGNRTAEDIAREAKFNPFVVRKSMLLAQKLNMAQLKNLISTALALDIRLKSENVDADEVLQYFLLTLTT